MNALSGKSHTVMSASKLAAESYALAYQQSFGLPTLAFRFFNVFGPRQSMGNPYTGELVRIGFIEDGSLLLSYDPGDLFGGHVVDGEFNPGRAFEGAYLVG